MSALGVPESAPAPAGARKGGANASAHTLLLALLLGLSGLWVQLSRPAPRLDADAVEYYSHLRSLYFDGDVDFANEFEHFGILERGDKVRPTVTGHRRSIFAVGAALLWMPFYAAGDLVARVQGDVEDGYSPAHIRAVCLGSLFYAVAGLLLVRTLLMTLFTRRVAVWTVLLLFFGTFLWWYAAYEPVMSHAGSFFCAALVLRVWWGGRENLSLRRGLALGAVIGFATTVRWQGAVLLLLPASSLLVEWLARRRLADLPRLAAIGGAVLAAFAIGALPQMLVWKAMYGTYLLADPPHGRDFLRLDHPFLWQTFFSSRHGLFYWTPILWAAFLGFLPGLGRAKGLTLTLLAPIAVMTYVNACSGDWWAGGSFSNRRFDSLLPLLAVGLAFGLDLLQRLIARRPELVLVALGLSFAVWNFLFMKQYRANLIPRDASVAFSRVAENNAALLADAVGAPLAWPANWIFAARYDLNAARYDRMVGQYLFYRQNNLGGVIDLGEPPSDTGLRDDAWGPPKGCGPAGALCREFRGRARLFAPLDVPETLDLEVFAMGAGTLRLVVNDTPITAWALSNDLRPLRAHLPAGRLRRELNELTFEIDASGSAMVDRLVFARVAR